MNRLGALWRERPAPRFTAGSEMEPEDRGRRLIRVCEHIDVRWLLEDMFAKLRRFAGNTDGLALSEPIVELVHGTKDARVE